MVPAEPGEKTASPGELNAFDQLFPEGILRLSKRRRLVTPVLYPAKDSRIRAVIGMIGVAVIVP
jgi:hypothetical protein